MLSVQAAICLPCDEKIHMILICLPKYLSIPSLYCREREAVHVIKYPVHLSIK